MAAPELRLNVSLDLGFFRQQLQKLSGIATSEFNAPLKARFDRTTLQKEIRLLNRYVNSKTFNIKINTNLEAEIKAADRLVQALQRVQQVSGKTKSGLPLGVQGLSRTAGQGGVSAAEIKALFSAAIEGGLLDERTLGKTRAQMVAALGTIGRDSIEGLLNGLESGDARLQKAAQSLGKSLITSFKDVLGIASPSREFRKIGDDAGKGFEQGLLKAMEIAERSATRQMQRMLDRLARMALMMGGMSAAEISRQIQATRSLPSLNWAATSPRNTLPIGPSSSGRLLTGGPSMLGLPGTAFGGQKYLPTALGEELKKVLRDAANAFIDAVKQNIREVRVREVPNLLAPGRIAGLLPPGIGRAPSPYAMGGESRAEMFARREREARIRSDLRSMDAMGGGGGRQAAPYSYAYRSPRPLSAIVPYATGGAIVPSAGGGGGVGGNGTGGGPGNFARRGGGFGGGFNMPPLPGAGLVREIGQEFAFATKQVLLFGTAYKALAFLTNFPAQVGQAVGQLQSFRNSLKAISPTAAEAAVSNQFILETVDKYNIPLQSARDGFIKLYASMQPAGFSGGEIRDLFLGISQAAASFGMSADKVDRVQYAFAQMASKGQVMSEELKGQLGDVLPGAMAIFAEAAGFKGPEAITKFSKALEDGAYKGDAMKTLLTNVGIVMRKEFGPGAEGAARTFQGVINRMQNSLKLLYESFEPAAVGFLNTVVKPMTDGIRTVADGFNAFFTGQTAKTAGGNALAQQLKELKPAFDGIVNNLNQLVPTFKLFGNVILGVAKAFTVIAGNPITGFLLKLYTNVLLVNGVFTLLGGKILVGLIGSIGTAISRFIAMNVAVATMQRTATVANSTLAGTQLQMALLQKSAGLATGPVLLLKNALLGLSRIGLIAIGINVVIDGLSELDRLKKSLAEIGSFSSAGFRKELSDKPKEEINSRLIVNRRTQQQIKEELKQYGGLAGGARGLISGRDEELRARLLMTQIQEQELIKANKTAQSQVSLQSQVTGITPMPAGTGETGGGGAKNKLDTYDRSTLDFIKQQGEQEQLALDRRRQQNLISETRYKIDSAALELEITRKEEAEKLRLATLTTNKDNLSAQDKQLKLTDLQTAYTNNLAIAQDKYNVAVEGAKKELEGPFNDAIQQANSSIMEQQMLLDNLQIGIAELTPDQQAYLQVLKLTTGKSEDELGLLQGKINALRQILEQQIAINKQVEIEKRIRNFREEIRLLSMANDNQRRMAELIEETGDPAKAKEIFDLEQIKKNLENVRAAIDDFVTSTSNDYKGFFKAVLFGEDPVEALKEFQKRLADKVLTIFLDFTMAPVEEFFKESLRNLLLPENIPGTDIKKEIARDPVEATNSNTNATNLNTNAIKELTSAIATTAVSDTSGVNTSLTTIGGTAMNGGESVSGDVANSIKQAVEETNQQGSAFKESLSKTVGAIGVAAGSIMGIAAGISQIKEGGTSNVLGGIGSILMGIGGGIAGFGSLFGLPGFANGGMVTGPTLGLVGEGKYNEAIVPLPDGRSIPVQMQGESIRDKMGGSSMAGTAASPVLSMSFQSTTINGVEYVSRDQLEQAMMETRKVAAKEGAQRGANLAIDKLQQSPNTRRRIGIR